MEHYFSTAKKEKQAAEKKVKKDAEARSHEEQAKVAKAEKIVKDEERAKKREEERQYTVSGCKFLTVERK